MLQTERLIKVGSDDTPKRALYFWNASEGGESNPSRQREHVFVVPDTVEVFTIIASKPVATASPDQISSESVAASEVIRTLFLIHLTGFSQNWYMVYDFRVYSVDSPGVFTDFRTKASAGIKAGMHPSSDPKSERASLDFMPSQDVDCQMKLGLKPVTTLSLKEISIDTVSYRQIRTELQFAPLTSDIIRLPDMATLDTILPLLQSTSYPLPTQMDLSLPLEEKHYKIAQTMHIRTSTRASLFSLPTTPTVLGEVHVSRLAFFHNGTGLTREGDLKLDTAAPFPVFGVLTLARSAGLETNGRDALVGLVGAVFGSWMCDALNPVAPYRMRVRELHFLRDRYTNAVMMLGAIGAMV
ncbi:hypothetical protein BC830DRAFT_1224043 [Chytriomyces sp. MP71]|nr:hypothetical protein BC830DRAFT_1224043 [Chytriomyces sp. MP71]